MKLGFIGTGNLASAILRGVVSAGLLPVENIYIFDVFSEKTAALSKELSVNQAASAGEIAEKCDGFIMAVKPKDIAALAADIKEKVSEFKPFIVSTAAGTELGTLSGFYGEDAKIIRIMPNINASVGESMTAVCPNGKVTAEEKDFVLSLCACFGKTVELDEKYFPVFSAVACCAPAFAYMFADALTMAGVKYGLTAKDARLAAAQMLMGSAKLLLSSPLSAGELIQNVTSPGGTTIEGICSLKETGFESSVIRAVEKAVEKDLKMSGK